VIHLVQYSNEKTLRYLFNPLTLLPPRATIVDNVHSALVSTEVDIIIILHNSEIYHILHSDGLWETMHCGVLSKN